MTVAFEKRTSATSGRIADRVVGRLLHRVPDMPAIYPKQEDFIFASERHVAFVAGIGSGKSIAGALRALRAAYGRVGAADIPTPNIGFVTAPTYKMLQDATVRTFRDFAGDYIARFNKSDMIATMRNGSEVLFRSTHEPENLRGPSISWWWGDEAALSSAESRKIMIGRIRQFGRAGYDWQTTTPRGRNHIWQRYVQDVRPGFRLIRAATRENVFQDAEIVADWEEEYVGDFARQELLGEFVAFEGLIYPEFDRTRHVTTAQLGERRRAVAGVDWGYANPGVILVLAIDGDGGMHLVDEHYQRQRRIDDWVTVAAQTRAIWEISAFFCDPSSPDNIRAFRQAGLPAQEADNTVLTGLEKVKARLAGRGADGRPRLVIGSDAANTIAEFEMYQWATNRHGVRDEPVKANDHAMDALRYAVMGIDGKKKTVTTQGWNYA